MVESVREKLLAWSFRCARHLQTKRGTSRHDRLTPQRFSVRKPHVSPKRTVFMTVGPRRELSKGYGSNSHLPETASYPLTGQRAVQKTAKGYATPSQAQASFRLRKMAQCAPSQAVWYIRAMPNATFPGATTACNDDGEKGSALRAIPLSEEELALVPSRELISTRSEKCSSNNGSLRSRSALFTISKGVTNPRHQRNTTPSLGSIA